MPLHTRQRMNLGCFIGQATGRSDLVLPMCTWAPPCYRSPGSRSFCESPPCVRHSASNRRDDGSVRFRF
jgi:hypothetical protein